MTGAQIKNMSEAVISYAISNKVDKITVETVVEVKNQLSKDLKDVYEMAEGEGILNAKPSPVGFETNATSSRKQWEEKFDWDSIMNPKTTKDEDYSIGSF